MFQTSDSKENKKNGGSLLCCVASGEQDGNNLAISNNSLDGQIIAQKERTSKSKTNYQIELVSSCTEGDKLTNPLRQNQEQTFSNVLELSEREKALDEWVPSSCLMMQRLGLVVTTPSGGMESNERTVCDSVCSEAEYSYSSSSAADCTDCFKGHKEDVTKSRRCVDDEIFNGKHFETDKEIHLENECHYRSYEEMNKNSNDELLRGSINMSYLTYGSETDDNEDYAMKYRRLLLERQHERLNYLKSSESRQTNNDKNNNNATFDCQEYQAEEDLTCQPTKEGIHPAMVPSLDKRNYIEPRMAKKIRLSSSCELHEGNEQRGVVGSENGRARWRRRSDREEESLRGTKEAAEGMERRRRRSQGTVSTETSSFEALDRVNRCDNNPTAVNDSNTNKKYYKTSAIGDSQHTRDLKWDQSDRRTQRKCFTNSAFEGEHSDDCDEEEGGRGEEERNNEGKVGPKVGIQQMIRHFEEQLKEIHLSSEASIVKKRAAIDEPQLPDGRRYIKNRHHARRFASEGMKLSNATTTGHHATSSRHFYQMSNSRMYSSCESLRNIRRSPDDYNETLSECNLSSSVAREAAVGKDGRRQRGQSDREEEEDLHSLWLRRNSSGPPQDKVRRQQEHHTEKGVPTSQLKVGQNTHHDPHQVSTSVRSASNFLEKKKTLDDARTAIGEPTAAVAAAGNVGVSTSDLRTTYNNSYYRHNQQQMLNAEPPKLSSHKHDHKTEMPCDENKLWNNYTEDDDDRHLDTSNNSSSWKFERNYTTGFLSAAQENEIRERMILNQSGNHLSNFARHNNLKPTTAGTDAETINNNFRKSFKNLTAQQDIDGSNAFNNFNQDFRKSLTKKTVGFDDTEILIGENLPVTKL